VSRHSAAISALVFLVGACTGELPDGPRVAIEVAPLTLTGIAEATYTLSVVNDSGDVVWSRQVTSSRYGDGAGSVSYVGPCDAEDNPNTVRLVVDGLADAQRTLVAGVDYMNPAPAGAPLERDVTCVEGADVAASFEISFARAARQGFFDVAVELDDVFCSAKLDCEDASGAALRLLHDDDGARAPTAVLAFACTGGAGADTHLYLSDLTLDCGGGDSVTVDPSRGPGKLSAVAGSGLPNAHLFDALVTRGDEQLGTYAKRYWSVALGLEDVAGCTLEATATASDGALDGGATPPGTVWPVVRWTGDFDDCGRHELNGADGVVAVGYTDFDGESFAHSYPEATTAPVVLDGATPGTAGSSCAQLHADYPAYTSQTYWVDPDGDGGVDPFEVWCDMDVEGGGWALFGSYANGETVVFVDPVRPDGAYGITLDAQWQALRDAMVDGMMVIQDDAGTPRVARVSAAKLEDTSADNCIPIGTIDSLVPGQFTYDFLWWYDPDCNGAGADYTFISLGYSHGTLLYQLNATVKFDLWPWAPSNTSPNLEMLYYIR